MLLVGATAAQAQSPYVNSPSDYARTSSADYVGDDSGYIGDLDADDVSQTGSVVGDMEVGAVSPAAPVMLDAVPLASQYSPAKIADSSQRSFSRSVSQSTYRTVSKPSGDHWFRAESLLWFTEQRDTPPLLVDGANNVLFGNGIDSGLAPGYRFDVGHYFAGGNVGIGARVWGLFGENTSYNASGGPASVLTRPFFDTTGLFSPTFGGLNISGTPGPPGSTGTFNAESEFDMVASEVYARVKFDETSNYRVDLLAGYSFFGIDDNLTFSSNTVAVPAEFLFRDSFDAENRFYGGQLGLETMIKKGRWSFTSLTKVHLGNMNQRVTLDGYSQAALFPNPPGPVFNVAGDNGLYIQGQGGVYEENQFAFVPEMNFRLGYSPRDKVHLTLGYTFAYWSSVALAGDQITPIVDGINAATFANVPAAQSVGYSIVDDGFWMQGIDLGVTFTF
jgi:hypothetical protein